MRRPLGPSGAFGQRLRHAWRRLRGGELTPRRAALSVAVGFAIGVTPLWGGHWLLVLAVCVPLRLDAPLAFLASNVSLPFVAPFLSLLEIQIGAVARTGRMLPLDVGTMRAHGLGAFVADLAIGTALLAPAVALVGGLIAYAVAALASRRSASSAAKR